MNFLSLVLDINPEVKVTPSNFPIEKPLTGLTWVPVAAFLLQV
jgi:hypothetical protein